MLSLHPVSRKVMRLGIAACGLAALAACGDNSLTGLPTVDLNLSRVAGFDQLKEALVQARNEANGGFNLDMWAAVVDRNGLVVAVVFTGATNSDQWPGSRVIAAQKANTGNAFSLPHLALSSANLYAATQPGGTLFGLQESKPTKRSPMAVTRPTTAPARTLWSESGSGVSTCSAAAWRCMTPTGPSSAASG